MRRPLPIVLILLGAAALAGCGTFGDARDPVEQRAERLRLPPDLNPSGTDDDTSVPGAEQHAEDRRAAAARPPQSEIERVDDRLRLLLPDSFYDAWRRVGLAVDRLGFTLEDRNRAQGRYFIRYDPRADETRREQGFLESLAFWRDEPDRLALYVIQLEQGDGGTTLAVTDEAGKPAPADVAERILTLLHEQLR
jgi:outer membrane protein assembly factor BamC